MPDAPPAPTGPTPGDPEPTPPEWPGDEACCGSGCDPCILDYYYQERDRYRVELKAWKQRQGTPPAA